MVTKTNSIFTLALFFFSFRFRFGFQPHLNAGFKKEKYDYYDVEPEHYHETERSVNLTARRKAAQSTNRSSYYDDNDNDNYESEEERTFRLAPIDPRGGVQRGRSLNIESVRRPVVFNHDDDADDEHDRQHPQRRPRVVKEIHVIKEKRAPRHYEPTPRRHYELPAHVHRTYEDDDADDDDDDKHATHVRIVKTKPRKKKVVVYHNYDENGQELEDPEYEVTYEDEDFYLEAPKPAPVKSKPKKQQYYVDM
jgi:hypothetical protein